MIIAFIVFYLFVGMMVSQSASTIVGGENLNKTVSILIKYVLIPLGWFFFLFYQTFLAGEDEE